MQVIGRIVRRHALLQARTELPPLLDNGYVFLANSESQAGLLQAGEQINTLTTQAPELGTQTVVTVVGDATRLQVVRSGEPLSLLVADGRVSIVDTSGGEEARQELEPDGQVTSALSQSPFASLAGATQALLEMAGGEATVETAADSLLSAFALAGESSYRYPRRADAPASLRGEKLPPVPADFEAGIAAHVNFSAEVLNERTRRRVQVQRIEGGLFDGQDGVADDGQDVWATMSPEAVAERAEQIRLRLPDANDRELYARLLERFVAAVEDSGADVPDDEEARMQQLDLVLVRRPSLLRDAYRSMRRDHVQDIDVPLPAELHSDLRLRPANRALYGVFPPGMNGDELAIAEQLDTSPLVRWWHRNTPARGLGLYRWDDGAGFYPDFVVCIEGRPGSGIALLEPKGEHLWGKDSEVDKSAAVHPDHGRVFMVGRKRGERAFVFLRELGGKLQSDGTFSVDRLRFA